MNDMKKYIYLLAISAFAIFGCVPTSQNEDSTFEYAGNKVKVTIPSDPIPADGGSLRVVVNNAQSLTYDISLPETANWLSMSRQDSVLTFTAQPNSSTDHRYASVGVIDTEKKIAITRFDVMQEGVQDDTPPVINYRFNVSPTEFNVAATDENVVINVSAENVEWTAASDNADFKLSQESGNTNAQITVSFPANTDTESEKTAVITVATASENVSVKSYAVTITQGKAEKTDGTPVKPAPGTVLAEWEFEESQVDLLRMGGIEGVTAEQDDAIGNEGDPYFPSNVSGNGKLEYFNGSDKSSLSTKKRKRRVGERGEPCIYCVFENDYFIWSATTTAPLAAGTKLQLNFAIRPNNAGVMKYWKAEYLDGEEWKELETITLEFNSNGAGTAEDPKQFNKLVKETVTLTKDTPKAAFRFTATPNAACGDGSLVTAISSSHVLRFAGKWSAAAEKDKYLQVMENPKIVVVE